MAKRKPTKEEAKEKIRELPTVPPVPPTFPPVFRAIGPVVRGAKALGQLLVDIDPLDRTAPLPARPIPQTRRSPESFARTERLKEGIRDVGRAIKDFELPSPDILIPRRDTRRGDTVNRREIIREVINDPNIEITEEMLPIINDPSILMDRFGDLFSEQFSRSELLREPKKKRKKSKYQLELGRQLKMLKKKHPRTPITQLMKRAHRLTKKAMK